MIVEYERNNLTPLSKGDKHCLALFAHDDKQNTYECWFNKSLKIIYEQHELPSSVAESLAFIRAVPVPSSGLGFTYDYQAYVNRHSSKLDGIGWQCGQAFGKTIYCVLVESELIDSVIGTYMPQINKRGNLCV